MIDAATSALDIAAAVRSGKVTAVEVARSAMRRIAALDGNLNCFTHRTEARALAEAEAVDRTRRAGRDPGPLAGVPFAAKNLFDVAGIPTLAGAKIERTSPPATRDAAAIRRLNRAGAVLLGTVNMDEYAMGFTTENAHFGPTRNPHDPARMAGGSSGGSAAAVAAGLAPLAIGTDTNGSISVPASLCGVFGLKPTFGRLTRAGTRLLASSFDHIGPMARSVKDLAAAYHALQREDAANPDGSPRSVDPVSFRLQTGDLKLRIAILDGFDAVASSEAIEAVDRVARALGCTQRVSLREAARARAAAMTMTGAEASNFHFADLRDRPNEFDPLVRDRLLAASLMPAQWYTRARRFRTWFRRQLIELFGSVEVLLAPATPFSAPLIGQDRIVVSGIEVPTRRHIGSFTQPLSFAGVPLIAAPVARVGHLPLGVLIVAAPWHEHHAFRVAAIAEQTGILAAPVAL